MTAERRWGAVRADGARMSDSLKNFHIVEELFRSNNGGWVGVGGWYGWVDVDVVWGTLLAGANTRAHTHSHTHTYTRTHTGAVYKVRRKTGRREVLCLKERRFAELGRKRDIMNEVRLLEKANHPNVIKCFGHFWELSRCGWRGVGMWVGGCGYGCGWGGVGKWVGRWRVWMRVSARARTHTHTHIHTQWVSLHDPRIR